MKTLLFGGTGFLGSHLCEQLLKKNHEVAIYKRPGLENTENINGFLKEIEKIEGVFSEENNFDGIVKGYDYVYQLISATVPSTNNPMADIECTIKPMLKLMDACVRQNVKKIIFFSSGGTVYGIPRSIPIKETHPTNPISAYGIHKLTIEKYLEYYYRIFNLNYTILRISNPYGARQKAFSSQGLIANVLGRYLTNQIIDIWGDGSVTRDYIYVSDVVEAAEKIIGYEGKEKIFNVASGRGYSVNEIISTIENVVDNKINVCNLEARKQDVPINVLDISLIKKELNWMPKISLESGIAKMVELWDGKLKKFDDKLVDKCAGSRK